MQYPNQRPRRVEQVGVAYAFGESVGPLTLFFSLLAGAPGVGFHTWGLCLCLFLLRPMSPSAVQPVPTTVQSSFSTIQ
jgi:hypothetical protein